jgi:hypothetical protein
MGRISLYLDDLREPPGDREWMIVRSSKDAINYVVNHGAPEYISFDHDLGGDDTAMIFLKWLIEYDLDNNGGIIPPLFAYTVHSANPVGKKNIYGLLDGYLSIKHNTERQNYD